MNKISIWSSLNTKIPLAFLVLAALAVFTIGTATYVNTDRVMSQQARTELTTSATLLSDQLELALNEAAQSYLKASADRMTDVAARYYRLDQLRRGRGWKQFVDEISSPELNRFLENGFFWLTDKSGSLLYYPSVSPTAPLRDTSWLSSALSKPEGYTEYFSSNKNQGPVELYCAWHETLPGFDAVLWASSRKGDFDDLMDTRAMILSLQRAKLSTGGYLYVMDLGGKIIMHPKIPAGTSLLDNKSGKTYYIDALVREILSLKEREYNERNLLHSASGVINDDAAAWYASREQWFSAKPWSYPGEAPRPQDRKPMLAFYKYLSPLGWIIVAQTTAQSLHSHLNIVLASVLPVIAISLVAIALLSVFVLRRLLLPLSSLSELTRKVAAGRLDQTLDVQTGDEMQDMSDHINVLVGSFRDALNRIKTSSASLNTTIMDLSSSSAEISATSNQQAAAIKEIVSTMEDSDSLSKNIAAKITEVARMASQSKEVISQGFTLVNNSLEKMNQIQGANTDTISGVRYLSEKIENIWEIVNIINNIADQTKIIAFNAELEASAAGAAGKNFKIVASEIRRLADSTVTSTNEIRSRISEIQHSSDNLIIASEQGTGRITEGWELSQKIRTVFEDILNSSQLSASSAGSITQTIKQQVNSFEQILITLRQLASSIDSFVSSITATSTASHTVQDMAKELKEITDRYTL